MPQSDLDFPLKSGYEWQRQTQQSPHILQSKEKGLGDNCYGPLKRPNGCDPENTVIHRITRKIYTLS